ncbi:MAG: GTP-binding protein [Candidatus Lokiarchaeota archaeon]|nr:GTP-binding protein [Candidatus Lokiarchaeota archaeon]
MPENPFENFTRIYDADELIDLAFKKGNSKSASIPSVANHIMKAKRKEVKKIQNVNNYILGQIKRIVQSVPDLDNLHPFYKELSHLLVDNDLLKKNLGKLNGLIPVFQRLLSELIRKINNSGHPNECAAFRRQYYARAASILKQQSKTLIFLEEARRQLKQIPTIDNSLPSIVVAGYPNVGKSSLVKNLSSANPEVCEYPFTTKSIIIGVYRDKTDTKLFQLIDTPGVLDRPMEKRNEIERQAILALRTISNIVLFMIDPTLTCGYSIENQLSLFHEVKENFIDIVDIPWLILINKVDLAREEELKFVKEKLGLKKEDYIEVVAVNNNQKELVDKIIEIINKSGLLALHFKDL